MEWAIYNVPSILNEKVQRENTSIIVKVTVSFLNGVWYASRKRLWIQLQGNDQNFWIIPRTFIISFRIRPQKYVRCRIMNEI